MTLLAIKFTPQIIQTYLDFRKDFQKCLIFPMTHEAKPRFEPQSTAYYAKTLPVCYEARHSQNFHFFPNWIKQLTTKKMCYIAGIYIFIFNNPSTPVPRVTPIIKPQQTLLFTHGNAIQPQRLKCPSTVWRTIANLLLSFSCNFWVLFSSKITLKYFL